MAVAAYEGTIEAGQVRLNAGVRLPDGARVYVVVPDAEPVTTARVLSPRLAHPEQAQDFEMVVTEVATDTPCRDRPPCHPT